MSRCYRPLKAAQLLTGAIVFCKCGGRCRCRAAKGRQLDLPCGSCIGCLKGRAQAWALRCVHESMMHDRNCFLTLTYADENLPLFSHLDYRDFQLFMKRLRKHLDKPIRFFAAGEYGDVNLRPHFHALIFGEDFREGSTLYKKGFWEHAVLDFTWRHGQVLAGDLTGASCSYVSQYAMKKLRGVDLEPLTGFVRSPKIAMSQGIGKSWFSKYSGDLKGDFAVLDSYEIPVPRYYRDRLREADPISYERVEFERYVKARKLIPLSERSDERLRVQEQVALARRAHFHSDREV